MYNSQYESITEILLLYVDFHVFCLVSAFRGAVQGPEVARLSHGRFRPPSAPCLLSSDDVTTLPFTYNQSLSGNSADGNE